MEGEITSFVALLEEVLPSEIFELENISRPDIGCEVCF